MFEIILKRISRVAEFIAAMVLAAIFIIFLLQIFTRYAPKIAWPGNFRGVTGKNLQ